MSSRQLEFVVFAIGSLAERLGISSSTVYNMLHKAGIIDGYLVPGYEVLHTFSRDYIVDDLLDCIKEKGISV